MPGAPLLIGCGYDDCSDTLPLVLAWLAFTFALPGHALNVTLALTLVSAFALCPRAMRDEPGHALNVTLALTLVAELALIAELTLALVAELTLVAELALVADLALAFEAELTLLKPAQAIARHRSGIGLWRPIWMFVGIGICEPK
jgi:hypothetical protein